MLILRVLSRVAKRSRRPTALRGRRTAAPRQDNGASCERVGLRWREMTENTSGERDVEPAAAK